MNKLFLLFLSIGILLWGCTKKEVDELAGKPALSFVESTLPAQELSAEGGSITIEVDWAHTQWNISSGDAEEGAVFIEQITPSYFGSKEQGATRTKVTVRFKKNNTYNKNTQLLTLRTLGDDIRQEVKITQAGLPVQPLALTLNPNSTFQTITGFGGGNMMWGSDFLTASEVKTVFGTGENELGLSVYRVRLSPVRSDWPSVEATLREAQKYGATILASPWSPPANLKSNNNLISGHLLESNYEAYANYLNDFVQHMTSRGIIIHAVSIQNEPDYKVNYESCDWTIDQMYNFVKNYGHIIKGTKLVAAESYNFKQSYTDKILMDPIAAANLDVVGGHIYGGGLAPYPLAEQKGKEIWMTEYLMNQNSGVDITNWNRDETVIWEETLNMLGTVHSAMSYNWNAYIWWYIRRFYSFLGDGEQGTTRSATLKRGYAMAQYAKYVRPGYVRIDAQLDNNIPGLKITAYKGDNKIVAVIINPGNTSVPSIKLSGPNDIATAVSYTTSVQENSAKRTLEPDGKTVTLNLEAKTVTTVVLSY